MPLNEYSECEFIKLRDKVHMLELDVARLQEQRKSSDAALVIATKALEHSQQVQNEWRQENIDQRELYPNIDRVDGQFAQESSKREALEGRVYVLEKSGSATEGKHSAFDAIWLKFVVVVTMSLTVLGLVYKFVTGR